jgi:hypothetical protein
MSDLNEFFSDGAGFYLYAVLVGISAVLLLVLFFMGIGSRAVNGIVGLIAVAYFVYLGYIFVAGGSYVISFWALILPIYAIAELVKGVKARNAAAAAAGQGQFPQAPPAA